MLTWEMIHEEMESCLQSKNQTVKQHCEQVWLYYCKLDEILSCPKNNWDLKEWIFPKWLFEYHEKIENLRYSSLIFYWYMNYHDLGKFRCRKFDSDGKQHFPDHAKISKELWIKLNKDSPRNDIQFLSEYHVILIGELILHDMDLHIMNSKEVDNLFTKMDSQLIINLLLASLVEIHANAQMWGGTDSVNFKIKWKQISRRGNQICKKIFGDLNDRAR